MIAKVDFDETPVADDPIIPTGYEMIDGELVEMPPMSAEASWIGGQLFAVINEFCMAHNLGRVYPQETVFRGFPGERITIRKPDAAFVRKDRLAPRPSKKDLAIAPDLTAEILSPTDTAVDVNRKIEQYLAAGVRLVWVVDPDSRVVLVFRNNGTVSKVRETEELDGEDVLPGFRCPVLRVLPSGEPESTLAAE
ncbi:MAG TPA: Uma2 family endonuclease [Gemmataceae bacterium]|nr:Uma2 family endonuclease [Gemmataceae bacterium]